MFEFIDEAIRWLILENSETMETNLAMISVVLNELLSRASYELEDYQRPQMYALKINLCIMHQWQWWCQIIYIKFNDTLYIQNIEQSDLMIRIFGSEKSYEFSWAAQFIDQSSVSVIMSIQSNIVGQGNESVVLDFLKPDKFVSIYSKRGVNPQELSGYLNTYKSTQTSSTSIGQTTIIVFLCSILIRLISSFGGN